MLMSVDRLIVFATAPKRGIVRESILRSGAEYRRVRTAQDLSRPTTDANTKPTGLAATASSSSRQEGRACGPPGAGNRGDGRRGSTRTEAPAERCRVAEADGQSRRPGFTRPDESAERRGLDEILAASQAAGSTGMRGS